MVRRVAFAIDWIGELAVGLLAAAYVAVAVGGVLIAVLAGLHWI